MVDFSSRIKRLRPRELDVKDAVYDLSFLSCRIGVRFGGYMNSTKPSQNIVVEIPRPWYSHVKLARADVMILNSDPCFANCPSPP